MYGCYGIIYMDAERLAWLSGSILASHMTAYWQCSWCWALLSFVDVIDDINAFNAGTEIAIKADNCISFHFMSNLCGSQFRFKVVILKSLNNPTITIVQYHQCTICLMFANIAYWSKCVTHQKFYLCLTQLNILLPLKVFLSSEGGLSLNSSLPILRSKKTTEYATKLVLSSWLWYQMCHVTKCDFPWPKLLLQQRCDTLIPYDTFTILFTGIEIQSQLAERRCLSVEMESTASLSLKGTEETRYQRRNWRLIERQNVSNFAEDPGPLLLRILKMLKSLRLVH